MNLLKLRAFHSLGTRLRHILCSGWTLLHAFLPNTKKWWRECNLMIRNGMGSEMLVHHFSSAQWLNWTSISQNMRETFMGSGDTMVHSNFAFLKLHSRSVSPSPIHILNHYINIDTNLVCGISIYIIREARYIYKQQVTIILYRVYLPTFIITWYTNCANH